MPAVKEVRYALLALCTCLCRAASRGAIFACAHRLERPCDSGGSGSPGTRSGCADASPVGHAANRRADRRRHTAGIVDPGACGTDRAVVRWWQLFATALDLHTILK